MSERDGQAMKRQTSEWICDDTCPLYVQGEDWCSSKCKATRKSVDLQWKKPCSASIKARRIAIWNEIYDCQQQIQQLEQKIKDWFELLSSLHDNQKLIEEAKSNG